MNKPTPKEYISNPFKVLMRGFNNLFTYNQNLAIIILLFGLVGMLGNIGSGFDFTGLSNSGSSDETESLLLIIGIIFIFSLVVLLPLIIIASTLFSGIMAYTALKTSQHQTATFQEALKASWEKFWTILWINVIIALKIIGGYLLFVIPGIRASARYAMVLIPVFDEGASITEAINKSKNLTKDHLLEIFAVMTFAGFVPFISTVLGVGGQSVLYPQLKELANSEQPKPAVHWLNYMAPLLIILLISFFALIILVIALIVAS